jgi:hypothetical protein
MIIDVFAHAGGLLAIFVLVHFMADWFPQSHREYYEKYRNRWVRLRHSAVYALHFIPLLIWLGMVDWTGVASLVILITSHYFIDSYWPIYTWMRYIRRPPDMINESRLNIKDSNVWLAFLTYIETPTGRVATLIIDQTLHIIVLLVVSILALLY